MYSIELAFHSEPLQLIFWSCNVTLLFRYLCVIRWSCVASNVYIQYYYNNNIIGFTLLFCYLCVLRYRCVTYDVSVQYISSTNFTTTIAGWRSRLRVGIVMRRIQACPGSRLTKGSERYCLGSALSPLTHTISRWLMKTVGSPTIRQWLGPSY